MTDEEQLKAKLGEFAEAVTKATTEPRAQYEARMDRKLAQMDAKLKQLGDIFAILESLNADGWSPEDIALAVIKYHSLKGMVH